MLLFRVDWFDRVYPENDGVTRFLAALLHVVGMLSPNKQFVPSHEYPPLFFHLPTSEPQVWIFSPLLHMLIVRVLTSGVLWKNYHRLTFIVNLPLPLQIMGIRFLMTVGMAAVILDAILSNLQHHVTLSILSEASRFVRHLVQECEQKEIQEAFCRRALQDVPSMFATGTTRSVSNRNEALVLGSVETLFSPTCT